MKLKKLLLFSLFISLLVICTFNKKIVKANIVDTEKIYCNATIEDDFTDNEVLVVLTNEESLEFNEYTINDFSEINCVSIEDLTDGYKDKIIEQLNGTYTGNMIVNLETFNRILKLTLSVNSKQYVLDSIKTLEELDYIKSAEPNYIMETENLGSPNDFYYNNSYDGVSGELNWVYESMNMREAWSYVDSLYEKTEVLVGVYDSGVDGDHEDLIIIDEDDKITDNVFADIGVIYDSDLGITEETYDDPRFYLVDERGHGTMISGIIAAYRNNGLGIAGVSSNAKIVSLRDNDQTIENFIECIEYAEENNVRLINCSRGFDFNITLREAIEDYPGLIICAAGNSGKNNDIDNSDTFPASYDLDNIISVGGLMIDDNDEEKILDTIKDNGEHIISHYGVTSVDLFAPGYEIVSTYYNGGYSIDSGTSYAAPFVTGVAALILSVEPNLTINQLKATILENVTTMSILSNKCVTGGKLNANAAVRNIHSHNFIYNYDSGEYHRGECSCGDIDIQPHIWRRNPNGGMLCIKCGGTSLLVNWIKEEEEEY